VLFGHQLTRSQAALDDVRNWLTPRYAPTRRHMVASRDRARRTPSRTSPGTVLGDGEGQLCSTGRGHDPAIAGF